MSVSDLFISHALAADPAPAQSAGIVESLMFMLPLLLLFYFLILRPQQKRTKEQKLMMDGLQKGDEVATIGGIIGTVTRVGDLYMNLEVADGVTMIMHKTAVQTVLPKGTIKSV